MKVKNKNEERIGVRMRDSEKRGKKRVVVVGHWGPQRQTEQANPGWTNVFNINLETCVISLKYAICFETHKTALCLVRCRVWLCANPNKSKCITFCVLSILPSLINVLAKIFNYRGILQEDLPNRNSTSNESSLKSILLSSLLPQLYIYIHIWSLTNIEGILISFQCF